MARSGHDNLQHATCCLRQRDQILLFIMTTDLFSDSMSCCELLSLLTRAQSKDAVVGKEEREGLWLQSSSVVYSGLCIQLLTELEDK